MSLKQSLEKRIDHAKERQQFWKEEKDIAKIWTGIERELTLVSGLLDEATKQIQEIDNDVDVEIQKFGYEGVYPSLIPCECDLLGQKRALKKVLSVLGGADNK